MARQIVVDASVALRLLLDRSADAAEVIRASDLCAPGVVIPETLNGLSTAVRVGRLDLAQAQSLLKDFLGLPVDVVPDRQLAAETLGIAANLGLSAYDASYVALAARRELPLATADRPVAERYPRSELIP